MTTLKEHLLAHHAAREQTHRIRAALFNTLALACLGLEGNPESLEGMEGALKKMAALEIQDADAAVESCKAAETIDELGSAPAALKAMLENEPEIAEQVRELVLKTVSSALGDKTMPTAIFGINPGRSPNVRAIPRYGTEMPVNTKPDVPIEFRKLVEIDG